MAGVSRALWTLAAFQPTAACTYFEVRSPVSGVPMVIGNTLEWFTPGSAQGYHVVVHPRGKKQLPKCAGGESWDGMLGFTMMQEDSDGPANDILNEAGLSISSHAIRGVATYNPPNRTVTVCADDFQIWMASKFESVADIRAALPTVAVLVTNPGTTSSPGTQWAIADAFGDSIVVDYVGGSMHVHDNRGVGVMANDPEYSWHLRNLNNYVALGMRWPDANEGMTCDSEIGPVPTAVGHGQNLLGLPGDVSPSSRFVRTFFMRNYAVKATPPTNLDEALVLANGVLNSQYIVKGFNAKLPSESGYDFTITSVLKVPESRLLFYRTYEDSQWRKVNLSAIDFSRGGSTRQSKQGFGAIDVTEEIVSGRDVV